MRKKDVKSIYGRPNRTSYEYMKLLKNENKLNVLIIDDKDALHSIPFANYDFKVTMHESNKDILKLINNRKHYKENKDNIRIINNNFYKTRIEEKYDFVYCYKSLHEDSNKEIPMNRKMRKLLSSVKDNGYVYIYYYLAKNDKDIKNQYFRRNEMISYFDNKYWNVLSIRENKESNIGHIFAKKKNNRLVHKYNYEIIGVE